MDRNLLSTAFMSTQKNVLLHPSSSLFSTFPLIWWRYFSPHSSPVVNNCLRSPLFPLLLRWCMFFLLCRHHPKPDVAHLPLLWSLQASEDPLNRNRKHFIARVATPLTQPHESRQGPPRRNTGKVPVPSTRCGRIFTGGRRCTGLHFVYLNMQKLDRDGDAHLWSGSRVIVLHRRPREAHLNATTAASRAKRIWFKAV